MSRILENLLGMALQAWMALVITVSTVIMAALVLLLGIFMSFPLILFIFSITK